MGKDIGDILWWFFTGALTLSTGLLFGFAKYLLGEKDTVLKELSKQLTEISLKLVALPNIEAEVKKHTEQINDIDRRMIKLEQRNVITKDQ